MSWIDKELRKREKLEAKAAAKTTINTASADAETIQARIIELWERFEKANDSLPPKLKLHRETRQDAAYPSDLSIFSVLLVSKNGAHIGFTGEAIRYIWPKKNLPASYNFWIRWHPEKGYRLARRIKPSWSGNATEERAFNESSIDYIFTCPVKEERVKYKSVRKRRLWPF